MQTEKDIREELETYEAFLREHPRGCPCDVFCGDIIETVQTQAATLEGVLSDGTQDYSTDF